MITNTKKSYSLPSIARDIHFIIFTYAFPTVTCQTVRGDISTFCGTNTLDFTLYFAHFVLYFIHLTATFQMIFSLDKHNDELIKFIFQDEASAPRPFIKKAVSYGVPFHVSCMSY